jgi:hypothetical protein
MPRSDDQHPKVSFVTLYAIALHLGFVGFVCRGNLSFGCVAAFDHDRFTTLTATADNEAQRQGKQTCK